MTMSTQAKLLRVLQEKTIQRVGGKETIPVDVRIIAATHRALETAIAQGEFREDLFYRLNVAVIKVPPLRERKEDIADHVTKDPTTGKEQRRMGLVSYFLHRYGPELGAPKATISPEAMEYLQQQSWPGNVRELENVIRKALLAAHGYGISLDHVRSALDKTKLSRLVTNQSVSDYVSELLAAAARGELSGVQFTLNEAVERELYAQAINLAQGNQAKAAKWLGVSRPTMREKLKLYGLRSLPERHIESDAL
jgi:DNA-binding NtrC family response regulator